MKLTSTIAATSLACLWALTAQAKAYKGGEVYTKAQYLYGRVETRMRAARGSGILSAFFTYKSGSEVPGTPWEEIDIEIFGKNDAKTWQSNVIVGSPRKNSEGVHTAAQSLADGYHTYTLEWAPTYVAWAVDGVEVRRVVGGPARELTNPEGLRFNLWASSAESWVGAFDAAALPQYQQVDWIRYYRYVDGQFVLDWKDDFNTFDTTRWEKASWTFDGNLVDFDPNNVTVKDGTLTLCMTRDGEGCGSGAPPTSRTGTGGAEAGGSGTDGVGGASHADRPTAGAGCAIGAHPRRGVGAGLGLASLAAFSVLASLRRRRGPAHRRRKSTHGGSPKPLC